MTRKIATGLTTFLVASFAATAALAQTLTIGHVLPDGDPRDLGADRVAEIMNNSQTCPMQAQVFPGASLCAHTDCIEQVQTGALTMTVLPASFAVGFQPLIGILDFPFFWPRDREKLLEVENSPAMEALLATMEDVGIKALDVWHTGYKIWTANKPLTKPDDFAGLKTRVMPSRILQTEAELLGMTATTFPFTEVYSALQSGAIDAQANPIPTTWQMKFHEVQGYASMTNHGLLEQLIMINKDWWDGLSEPCQAELRQAVEAGEEVTREATYEQIDKALGEFKAAGVELVEVPEESIAAMRQQVLPQIEKIYVEETGERGRQILEGLKQEIGIQ